MHHDLNDYCVTLGTARPILPDVISNYFSLNSSIHGHLTLTQSNIHIHRADTTFGKRSIRYKGGTL